MKKNTVLIFIFLSAACLVAGFLIVSREKVDKPIALDSTTSNNYHYSYFSQLQFFDDAYEQSKNFLIAQNQDVKAIIANHHLLASSFIAQEFNQIATTAEVTVLLVSPNHFDAGKADIITSNESWKTPYGVLEPDKDLVNKIVLNHVATIEEDPFGQEHGVSGIVAFIKKSLPNAKVVPVIFRNRMTLEQAQKAADDFQKILNADKSSSAKATADASARYIAVGSFDFSHYLPSRAADFHDLENLSDVESFNFSSIYNSDIDSRPGLAFFLQLLKNQGAQNFHLLQNSNSAKLAHQDILETTSYIDGYFTHGLPSSSDIQTELVLPAIDGSVPVADSLNRNSKNWSVKYMERLFFGQDRTLINIEGDKNLVMPILQRYGITDFGSINSDIPMTVEYGASTDFIEFLAGKIIIHSKNKLLSDNLLKNGGTSVAYGIAQGQGKLTITILPIGINNGIIKLLIGKENDTVLKDIAAKSPVSEEIKREIEKGLITSTIDN